MDSVVINHVTETVISRNINDNSVNPEIYAPIATYCQMIKNEMVYESEIVSNEEYQSALNCLTDFDRKCGNEQKINFSINRNKDLDSVASKVQTSDIKYFNNLSTAKSEIRNNVLETENAVISFQATDDESMAVEALRQLGSMFNSIVAPEQNLPLLNCTDCNTKFHTTSDLQAHKISCKQTLIYKCALCNEHFPSESDFSTHSCQKFNCKFCSESFIALSELRAHENENHPGDRPYQCHVCNQNFPRPSSLTNHLKIHNYQPGRALLHSVKLAANKVETANCAMVNGSSWGFSTEPRITSDVCARMSIHSNSCTDSSVNINSSACVDINSDEGVIMNANELSITDWHFNYDSGNTNVLGNNLTISDEKSYERVPGPVKIELVLPFSSEKCSDEQFPISSLPQMEVTITTDDKKPHTCPHCFITFSRAKALVSHLKMHTIECVASFDCQTCHETFFDEASRIEHQEQCLKSLNDPLTQVKGDKGTRVNKITNEKTVLNKVTAGKHPCPDCDKRFATKQKMFRHMWIHRKKSFTCELCATTFELQSDLDKHRLSQHPADSPYVCQECGKSFASRQGLWEHSRLHISGSAGLFSCLKCKKSFASRQGYLIHNRIHTGERPYGCRFCLKAFRDGGTLRKHERIHTGERPHVCPICSHDFNQKVVLREHVRWVHAATKTVDDDGVIKCQICDSPVSDREELCAHIVRHSDQLVKKSVVVKTAKGAAKEKKSVGKDKKQLNCFIEAKSVDSGKSYVGSFDFAVDDTTSVECDLCGHTFLSQKDLMTHVHIHI